jgi:Helix-turn-helix domain
LGGQRSRVMRGLRPDPSLLRSSAESRRIVVQDAAAILGCSPAVVRRLLNDGILHGRRFTIRGMRVTRESLLKLMRWLEASEEDERLIGIRTMDQAVAILQKLAKELERRSSAPDPKKERI